MKVQPNRQSIVERTIPAMLVEARLDYQHKRWLLSQFPDYQWKIRERLRQRRQKQIARKRKFDAFKAGHPMLFWLGDLFAFALGVVILLGMFWFLWELIAAERRVSARENPKPDDLIK